MKRIILLLIPALLLGSISCKKSIYGCTDSNALNHSNKANVDDGSCYYDNIESDEIIINSWDWSYSNPMYYALINYPAITQEVVDQGAVLVYMETSTNYYSQLPVTFYPSSQWSTSVEVVHTLSQLQIIWTDSDLNTLNPGSWKFKIVVIHNKSIVSDEDIKKELMKK
ncbi:MAG: hypothetical protein EP305_04290 [Bacteroidetes bacterium]|nr:MAG: hypothetical protein EP305_04290 [Bacteroidota bacterium]